MDQQGTVNHLMVALSPTKVFRGVKRFVEAVLSSFRESKESDSSTKVYPTSLRDSQGLDTSAAVCSNLLKRISYTYSGLFYIVRGASWIKSIRTMSLKDPQGSSTITKAVKPSVCYHTASDMSVKVCPNMLKDPQRLSKVTKVCHTLFSDPR